MIKIIERLNLPKGSLGVHWYNWDLLGRDPGNPNYCQNETTIMGTYAPCGFDTHYPEYLPALNGFSEDLKTIQNLGVRVVPYTNGHLFDTVTKDWTPMLAQKAAVKNNRRHLIADLHDEHPDWVSAPPVLNIT